MDFRILLQCLVDWCSSVRFLVRFLWLGSVVVILEVSFELISLIVVNGVFNLCVVVVMMLFRCCSFCFCFNVICVVNSVFEVVVILVVMVWVQKVKNSVLMMMVNQFLIRIGLFSVVIGFVENVSGCVKQVVIEIMMKVVVFNVVSCWFGKVVVVIVIGVRSSSVNGLVSLLVSDRSVVICVRLKLSCYVDLMVEMWCVGDSISIMFSIMVRLIIKIIGLSCRCVLIISVVVMVVDCLVMVIQCNRIRVCSWIGLGFGWLGNRLK